MGVSENAQGLNKGRNVGKIEGVFGGGSMFKLPGAVSTRCQNFPALEKGCQSFACWRPCDGVQASSAVRVRSVHNSPGSGLAEAFASSERILARQAHQVSECVFLSPVISTPGSRGC